MDDVKNDEVELAILEELARGSLSAPTLVMVIHERQHVHREVIWRAIRGLSRRGVIALDEHLRWRDNT